MWGAPTACTYTTASGRIPHDGAGGRGVVEVDVGQQDGADVVQAVRPSAARPVAQGVQARLGTRIDQRDAALREFQDARRR